ncbi:MAG TPA: hypothetical protein PKH72_04165 [Rhodoferax sp.]|jgi:hypothetical protein|nr:hypothetical protein [Rhodoferax sp.]HNV58824.1 hypothetical protein [Rhodoferax sp.]HPW28539.1 hypothetical protein [Rhodoferax sp.]
MNTTLNASFAATQGPDNIPILVADFPYQDIVHPAHRGMSMKRVVDLARRDAIHFGMRVYSLESAQRVLLAASDYSEWNACSYRPALELIASALAARQCEILQRSLGRSSQLNTSDATRSRWTDVTGQHATHAMSVAPH